MRRRTTSPYNLKLNCQNKVETKVFEYYCSVNIYYKSLSIAFFSEIETRIWSKTHIAKR